MHDLKLADSCFGSLKNLQMCENEKLKLCSLRP